MTEISGEPKIKDWLFQGEGEDVNLPKNRERLVRWMPDIINSGDGETDDAQYRTVRCNARLDS